MLEIQQIEMSMENIELLRECSLFKGMKDRQIENALRKLGATEKKYRKNSLLITKGQKEMQLGLMLEGEAVASQDDVWGNKYMISEVKCGQTFAEPYAAADMPSNIIVQAKGTCRVLWLNVSKINFAGNDPVLLLVTSNLLQDMAFKLLNLNQRLTHISKQTTQEKLLSYLSAQSEEAKSLDFVIPFNRQELADYLSVERSAMSAELSKLVEDGKLKTRKNRFTLYP